MASRFQVLGPLSGADASRSALGLEILEDGRAEPVVIVWVPEAAEHDAQLLERIRRETEHAASLDHPNIVHVAGFAEFEGRHARVVEFADGETLRKILEVGEALTPRLAARVVCDACTGAHYAHVAGNDDGSPLVHGGIRPETILISFAGVTRVTGYGALAFAPRDPGGAALKGHPVHSAPEQVISGREAFLVQTDVYLLGLMLYECLTGRVPWQDQGEHFEQAVLTLPLPPPPVGIVPRALEAVLEKACSKKAIDRYPTALALREAIEGALGEDIATVDELRTQLELLIPESHRLRLQRRHTVDAGIADHVRKLWGKGGASRSSVSVPRASPSTAAPASGEAPPRTASSPSQPAAAPASAQGPVPTASRTAVTAEIPVRSASTTEVAVSGEAPASAAAPPTTALIDGAVPAPPTASMPAAPSTAAAPSTPPASSSPAASSPPAASSSPAASSTPAAPSSPATPSSPAALSSTAALSSPAAHSSPTPSSATPDRAPRRSPPATVRSAPVRAEPDAHLSDDEPENDGSSTRPWIVLAMVLVAGGALWWAETRDRVVSPRAAAEARVAAAMALHDAGPALDSGGALSSTTTSDAGAPADGGKADTAGDGGAAAVVAPGSDAGAAAADSGIASTEPVPAELDSSPPSELTVDGEVVGKTPWKGTLPLGRHTLVFTNKAALLLAGRVLTAQPSQPIKETFTFEKGYVTIVAPPEAAVFIDGVRIGTAPLKADAPVYEGTHRVVVTVGKARWTETFTIYGSERVHFDVQLE